MSATIRVPLALRTYSEGAAEIHSPAPTVRAALKKLESTHPALYRCVCDETGAVRRHLNIFVNSAHMRDRQGLDTALEPEGAVRR